MDENVMSIKVSRGVNKYTTLSIKSVIYAIDTTSQGPALQREKFALLLASQLRSDSRQNYRVKDMDAANTWYSLSLP